MDKKIIFLIDFDITISKNDSTDVLLETHNPEHKKIIREKYKNKEISIREFIKYGLEALDITKEEFLQTLKKIEIDRTFVNFAKSGVDFKIVSAGTRLNVIGTLNNYELNLTNDEVISNDIDFSNNKITISNPFLDKEQYYGVDKKEIVKQHQKEGYTVYFVGDGPSDYKAMEIADFVFVRKDTRAVNFCRENNISFKEFDNFDEVLEYKKTLC